MTKKLLWRLKSLPTTDELRDLVKDGILTKEEAREVLFSQEDEKERDVKSLETEIKFLREVVAKLSQNSTQIVETIEKVYVPYKRYPWYEPYQMWCGVGTSTGFASTITGGNVLSAMTAGGTSSFTTNASNTIPKSFDQIKTF